MPFHVATLDSNHLNYPSALRNRRDRSLFPQIWTLGSLGILERPLLGLFCSIKCPGDLILRTYDLVRALREASVAVIGGFHSPIEKDCLDLLLRGNQPIVFCPARSIENMRIGQKYNEALKSRRLLILSPIEKKVRRPTVETSQYRNQFISALAASVFVSYADPGGKTKAFCREMLSWKKPLYTFESDYNKHLIEMGAQPISADNVTECANFLAEDVNSKV